MKKKKKITDEDIKKAAARAADYKGGAWGATEFQAMVASILYHLEKDGATPKQIKKFNRLVDEAPVIGKSFNPYSGD